MFRYMEKNKGSISIFLCIVLFVVMITNGIMVDAGRLRSADTLVKSATDSATMSTLADYNTPLKEYYGLFALSESDQSKLCDVFNYYFLPTLMGTESEDDNVDRVMNYITENLSGKQNRFADASFLNMYEFQMESLDITPMYSLAEPDPLRNQIVEFSKYRVPSFYAENKFSEAFEQLQKVQKDLELVQLKMELDKKIMAYDQDLDAFEKNELSKVNLDMGPDAVTARTIDDFKNLKELHNEYIEEKNKEPKPPGSDASTEDWDSYHDEVEAWKNKLKELKNKILSEEDNQNNAINSRKAILSDLNSTIDNLAQKRTVLIGEIATFNEKAKQKAGTNDSTATRMIDQNKVDVDRFNSYRFDLLKEDVNKKIQAFDNSLNAFEKYDVESENPDNEIVKVTSNFDLSELKLEHIDRKTENKDLDSFVGQANNKLKQKVELPLENIISEEDLAGLPSRTYKDREKTITQFDAADSEYAKSELENAFAGANYSSEAGAEEVNKALESMNLSTDAQDTSFFKDFNLLNKLFDGMNNALASGRDSILINEYIMNMFKTRTTDVIYNKNPDLKAPDPPPPYIISSRYGSAEENLKWLYKKDSSTFFNLAEVEYVLTGNKSEKFNANAVYAQIMMIRMIVNLIAIYSYPPAIQTISAISASMSGPLAPVVFWAIILAWAATESGLELSYLIDQGYKIPLFKKLDANPKLNNMNITLESLLNGELFKQTPNINPGDKILFAYEDFLRLFLYMVPMDTRLLRTADLVQLNIGKHDNQSGFLMEKAYTYLRVDTTVSMKYMFMTSGLMPAQHRFPAGKRHKIHNLFYQGY